jgi:Asp-tRNA(Asn)/Glu-tRNA(Gln) amidotransferase A subunit family amidase
LGFAIGTETLGSISSPSTRCGATGLRPTFGFVPRTGAMALTWTMDKIGPICRSVEDCALVMSTIYGKDGKDRSVQNAAFNWDAEFDWKKLRVGYLKDEFDAPTVSANATEDEKRGFARRAYDARFGTNALEALRKMGVNLLPMKMPAGYHFGDITPVLEAEAAAAFDELTRSGRDALLTEQGPQEWPNVFRVARFYSAVDYIQAQRARTLAMDAMAKIFADVDVIVTPSNGAQLTATNLTGHPAVIVPNGVRGEDAPLPDHTGDGHPENVGGPGTPVSLTFLGGLYSDARLAAFARAYQETTGFHRMHPKMD